MTSLIEFENVSFSYKPDRPLLKGVDLAIGKGEFVAIMGGSGCGKTTLLRLISGRLVPDSGRILIEGRDLARFDRQEMFRHRQRMGVLFQFGALFSDLSVGENVAFPLREHTALSEERVRSLVLLKLDAVGLRGTEEMMPQELSGGMVCRVALARAMALDPQLMLFDEPFTGLDPITLGVISHLIDTTNRSIAATSVMVTHDKAQSLNIADRIVFLSEGRIIHEGAPEEVRRTDNPWVRQFIDGKAEGPVQFRHDCPRTLEEDLLGAGRNGRTTVLAGGDAGDRDA